LQSPLKSTLASRTWTAVRRLTEAVPGGAALIESYRSTRRARRERALHRRRLREARAFIEGGRLFPEAQGAVLADFEKVSRSTQVSVAGICNLEAIARHMISRGVAGSFVECGTWRGGALAYWAHSYLRNGGLPERSAIFGFDSFEGMPQMTRHDGDAVARWLHRKSLGDLTPDVLRGTLAPSGHNLATEADCRATVMASGFPSSRIWIIKGWFQNTLPAHKAAIGSIAALRLDCDFYESTRCCLDTLYDQVVSGGAVIIDDYGAFPGCRKAVDEFLTERAIDVHLVYVDDTIRFFHKP
jgi:O-methyltransferase